MQQHRLLQVVQVCTGELFTLCGKKQLHMVQNRAKNPEQLVILSSYMFRGLASLRTVWCRDNSAGLKQSNLNT